MTISELMDFIAYAWPLDEAIYPGIDQLPPDRRLAFCLGHEHKHAAKALGKIAEAIEPLDHGMPLDRDKLREALAKSLIATLRAAETVGITADDLRAEIKKYFTL